ncbi:MAG: hypothetical protein HQM08_14065 [Candidatus Riflebacteria bacterium]|nr:hypothetical protein [Candidatus Riflebacteria bacterium]
MKNFLMLSPHYPPRLYLFAEGLVGNDFQVLGIGDAFQETLKPDLSDLLTDYRYLTLNCYSGKARFDESRYEPIYRTVADFIARYGRLQHIESFNEYWLPLEARLREDFNVPGPRPEDLLNLICKSKMKKIFQASGVDVVRGEILRDEAHLLSFLGEEKTIIAKPDIGVGASDTHKISTIEDAKTFFSNRNPETVYFLERFIGDKDRELLSYDGLADLDGNVIFSTIHPVNHGLLEIVSGEVLSYFNLRHSDIPALFQTIGPRLIQKFGIKGRFFHIEFFRVGSTYFGLEMNSRPPGVLTLDMINYANGINICEIYARMLNGFSEPVIGSRDLMSLYIGRVNRLSYKLSHEEIMEKYQENLGFHCPMDSPVMGDYAYILVVADHEERKRVTADITATL